MSGYDSGTGPPACEGAAAGNDRPATLENFNPASTIAVSCPPTNVIESANCRGHRRRFLDGERCFTHWTDDDRALVSDLDARSAGIGLPERDDPDLDRYRWPHGLDHRTDAALRLLEWAEARQLRLSFAYGHPCPGWLTGGDHFEDCPGQAPELTRVEHFPGCERTAHCDAAYLDHVHAGGRPCPGECWCYVYHAPADHCPGLRARTAFDHHTTWEGPQGLRVAVGQPYRIGEAEAGILAEFRADARLSVQVMPPGHGWHHPNAWFVVVAGFATALKVAA